MSEPVSTRRRLTRRAVGVAFAIIAALALSASSAFAARTEKVSSGQRPPGAVGESVASATDVTEVVVTAVVDGDTVVVSPGGQVRVIGIDTPERGRPCYGEATDALKLLVMNKTVRISSGATNDRDRHHRLLRYVDVDDTDAGRVMIEQGYAVARYDSRDGYGPHLRETDYVTLDKESPAACPRSSEPRSLVPPIATVPSMPTTVVGTSTTNDRTRHVEPLPLPAVPSTADGQVCDPSYPTLCLPVGAPDLDCADVSARRFPVVRPDRHRFDGDGDGVGCER
jgi:endonuclease YncB( thermonuclease family)